MLKKRLQKVWLKIERTSNDLTTLEINTIVKSDMTCVKPSDNDRLALYRLAGKYHDKLLELGNIYHSCLQNDEIKARLSDNFNEETKQKDNASTDALSVKTHLFRRIPHFEQGGIVSFIELAMSAKMAKETILTNMLHFKRDENQIENDLSVITRIELKSLELVSILADQVNKKNETVYKEFWTAYGADRTNRVAYLDELHKILSEGVGFTEDNTANFLNKNNFPFELDLRDQILVRRALDLGTERVLMQTRIGMDGDVTTRIAEKFADNPEQFILDIHNDSIQTSVSYWTKLVDALVSFGKNILGKFKP